MIFLNKNSHHVILNKTPSPKSRLILAVARSAKQLLLYQYSGIWSNPWIDKIFNRQKMFTYDPDLSTS